MCLLVPRRWYDGLRLRAVSERTDRSGIPGVIEIESRGVQVELASDAKKSRRVRPRRRIARRPCDDPSARMASRRDEYRGPIQGHGIRRVSRLRKHLRSSLRIPSSSAEKVAKDFVASANHANGKQCHSLLALTPTACFTVALGQRRRVSRARMPPQVAELHHRKQVQIRVAGCDLPGGVVRSPGPTVRVGDAVQGCASRHTRRRPPSGWRTNREMARQYPAAHLAEACGSRSANFRFCPGLP